MDDKYTNPEIQEFEDDEINIDFVKISIRLLKKWKQICAIGFLFGAIGIVMALRAQKMYTVTASIAPESQRAANSSLNGIASMLGITGGSTSSVDALNISYFPQICKSTPFLTDLFDVKIHYNQSLEDKVAGKPLNSTTVYEHIAELDKPLTKRQIRKIEKAKAEGTYVEEDTTINVSHLTGKQVKVASYLSKNILASVDKNTGFTKISVTMDDPLMATELTDTVVAKLQEYVIAYRTKKVQGDLDYYTRMAEEARQKMVEAQGAYAASVDYNRSVILQSANAQKERLRNESNLATQVYNQMEQQKEVTKAKLQEEKPVFAVIQPATMPIRSITSRKKIVLLWGIIGGFLACLWYGVGQSLCSSAISVVKERWNEDDE